MLETGISSWAMPWRMRSVEAGTSLETVWDFLRRADAFGFKRVQLADNLPVAELGETDLERIREYASNRGVKIEVGGRSLTRDNLHFHFHVAETLDAALLRFVIDGKDYEPELGEVELIIREILPELEKSGITLAIENHDRFRSSELAKLMMDLNNPRVGICLDTVNSLGAGEDVWRATETLARWVVNLHLKDYSIVRKSHQMGFIVEGRPLGGGVMPLNWILSKLDAERCKTAVLELWVPPESNLALTLEKEDEWIRLSCEFLQKNML